MKLSIGVPASVEKVELLLQAIGVRIDEIYLATDNPYFGTGRDLKSSLDIKGLSKIAKVARKYDVDVRLLLNAPFFHPEDSEGRFEKTIRDYYDEILRSGVNRITVADARLLVLAKKYYPALFHIAISSYAHIDNIETASLFEDLGADRLILPNDLVREINLLRNIRESVNCEIEVIANLGCQYACPAHTHHGAYLSEVSRLPLNDRSIVLDPYREHCTSLMAKEPWRIVAGSWIRPEDVHVYKELGVDFIKIVGRNLKSSWLIRTAEAYLNKCYKGNVLDLLTPQFTIANKINLQNEKLEGLLGFVGQCNKQCFGTECTFFDRKRSANRCQIFSYQASYPSKEGEIGIS